MKKLLLLVGAGIGFVLGSRAGRGPYEQLDGQARKFLGRPTVQQRLDAAKSAASHGLEGVTGKAKDKLPGTSNGSDPTPEQGSDPGLALGTE